MTAASSNRSRNVNDAQVRVVHQLRTPLTILTAGLDVLEGDGKIQALRGDVARCSSLNLEIGQGPKTGVWS